MSQLKYLADSGSKHRESPLPVTITSLFVTGFFLRNSVVGYIAILLLILAHGWRNNTMMAYVERNAYDGSELK